MGLGCVTWSMYYTYTRRHIFTHTSQGYDDTSDIKRNERLAKLPINYREDGPLLHQDRLNRDGFVERKSFVERTAAKFRSMRSDSSNSATSSKPTNKHSPNNKPQDETPTQTAVTLPPTNPQPKEDNNDIQAIVDLYNELTNPLPHKNP